MCIFHVSNCLFVRAYVMSATVCLFVSISCLQLFVCSCICHYSNCLFVRAYVTSPTGCLFVHMSRLQLYQEFSTTLYPIRGGSDQQ